MVEETENRVYQLKIIIQWTGPETWRTVLVPEHFTLNELHMIIKKTLNWTGEYLWLFGDFEDQIYGNLRISDVFQQINQEISYIYDFNVNRHLIIKLETVKKASTGIPYPICVAGHGQCPRESAIQKEEDENTLETNEEFEPTSIDL